VRACAFPISMETSEPKF